MKLYQNLWAGQPAYFLETHESNFFKKGVGFWYDGNGGLFIDFHAEYRIRSFKEAPERFPLIGEMSDREFADMIINAAKQKGNTK